MVGLPPPAEDTKLSDREILLKCYNKSGLTTYDAFFNQVVNRVLAHEPAEMEEGTAEEIEVEQAEKKIEEGKPKTQPGKQIGEGKTEQGKKEEGQKIEVEPNKGKGKKEEGKKIEVEAELSAFLDSCSL